MVEEVADTVDSCVDGGGRVVVVMLVSWELVVVVVVVCTILVIGAIASGVGEVTEGDEISVILFSELITVLLVEVSITVELAIVLLDKCFGDTVELTTSVGVVVVEGGSTDELTAIAGVGTVELTTVLSLVVDIVVASATDVAVTVDGDLIVRVDGNVVATSLVAPLVGVVTGVVVVGTAGAGPFFCCCCCWPGGGGAGPLDILLSVTEAGVTG